MPQSDLFLDEDFTKIVNRLEIATAREADSDIVLFPRWATIDLGGGAGSHSDGDVKLIDRDGNERVHFDAGGGGPSNDRENRIYLDGSEGRGEFADHDGVTQVEVDGGSGRIEFPTGSGGEMAIDGSTGSMEFVRNRYMAGTPYVSDSRYTSPMLNVFEGTDVELAYPLGRSGPKVPIVAYSARMPTRGLMYDDEHDQFVFQEGPAESIPASGGSQDIDFEGSVLDIGDSYPVLTVDLEDDRVGVGTDEPEHRLHVDGQVKAANVSITSDARCKTSVEPLTDALETVTDLEGVSYEWTEAYAPDEDGRHLGFVADEVETVLPEVVDGGGEELRSLAQSELTALLVEAIKEQQADLDAKDDRIAEQAERIEEQTERLDRQADRLDALESRLEEGAANA